MEQERRKPTSKKVKKVTGSGISRDVSALSVPENDMLDRPLQSSTELQDDNLYSRTDQSSSIECDIRDAALDIGDGIVRVNNSEQNAIYSNRHSLAETELDDMLPSGVTNIQLHEINGNHSVQETELNAIILLPANTPVSAVMNTAVPTAPAVEESSLATSLIARTVDSNLQSDQEKPSAVSVLPCFIVDQNFAHYKPLTENELTKLYGNQELEVLSEYLSAFLGTQLLSRKDHPFYEKLIGYLRTRECLLADLAVIEIHKHDCDEQQSRAWTFQSTTVTESGECQDGNPVTASLESTVAQLNFTALSALTKCMNSIKDLCNETIPLHWYSAEVLREKLMTYVDTVCTRCLSVARFIGKNAGSIQLLTDGEQMSITNQVSELRTCIGILFQFQRREIDDSQFVADTRFWLTKCISILLRVAVWQDHMFLIHHVLRSPSGMAKWMMQFVQIPLPQCEEVLPSPFKSRYLAHMVATLATLMDPIKQREQFLEQYPTTRQATGNDGGMWVIVDSDGEEDDANGSTLIKESDAIALLNQIPMEYIFRVILLVEKQDNSKYQLDISHLTDQHMMRLFAFSTILVRLFQRGLQTYGTLRYKQFAKRLGRLITHTVKHISDIWEAFRLSNSGADESTICRLQCEYSAFFLRSTQAIFSSQKLGTWQFLAVLPYNLLPLTTLWQIFCMLHHDYNDNLDVAMPTNDEEWEYYIQKTQVLQEFEDKINSLPESEAFYLLSAFSSMVVARGKNDMGFVRTVTLDLFQIGFLSDVTQDRCSKFVRTLLATITSKHPSLVSDIVINMAYYSFMNAENLCLVLFKELPLTLWIPTEHDFVIISRWLLEKPLLSTQNSLARLILSNLNYSCTPTGLMLAHSFHCKVALLIVEAMLMYAPEATTNTGAITSTMSNYVRPGSGSATVSAWGWGVMSRLRLHVLDQDITTAHTVITHPETALRTIPDLYEDPKLEVLASGVLSGQPIACYLAVLMTSWGHSVPLICSKGFTQVEILLQYSKYDAVLACLHLLVPMFVNCTESLISCNAFKSILITVCTADKTYLKMAKSLMSSDFPGPVLRQAGNMIEYHIGKYEKYCLKSPDAFICLWMKSLTRIPGWVNENSVLYLMDIILRAAYCTQSPSTNKVAVDILKGLYMTANTSNSSSSVANFFSWVTMGTSVPSILVRMSLPIAPWYAMYALDIEEEWQTGCGLWGKLQHNLFEATGKANVDAALKNARAALKISATMPPYSLSIYRWAQQAMDTPFDHPLLPYLWQRFFVLYLARVPADPPNSKGSVGHKFFEGMMNLNFLKRIKKRLLDTISHYAAQSSAAQSTEEADAESGLAEGIRETEDTNYANNLYANCSKLFKTYVLWLEEPRLMEANLVLWNLPPMYSSKNLSLIFTGDNEIWQMYFDSRGVAQCRKDGITQWQKAHFRNRDTHVVVVEQTNQENTSPVDRILRRLRSYDTPEPPESLSKCVGHVMRSIPSDVTIYKSSLINFVDDQLAVITDCAQAYMFRIAEHTSLDCTLLELLPSLYSNTETEKVIHAVCNSSPPQSSRLLSRPSHVTCAGPAYIRILVYEARPNDAVEKAVDQNREEYFNLLLRVKEQPKTEPCVALISLESVAMTLAQVYEENLSARNHSRVVVLHELGLAMIYNLISTYSEELAFFPPSREIVKRCLEILAKVFVYKNGEQAEQLLSTLLVDGRLAGILSPYFSPEEAKTAKFIEMYCLLGDKAYNQHNSDLCFVLLSKFDVKQWLEMRRPNLTERSSFISVVVGALVAGGLQPESDKQMLHEIFRKHLMIMLLHSFPEHFGEVLNHILEGSANQRISLDVWYDFIDTLKGEHQAYDDVQKLKEDLRAFATEQRLLSYNELLATAWLLGNYFMKERLAYGLYGLYPKYRTYVVPIITFQTMVGHSLTVSTLRHDRGSLTDSLCNQLWPALRAMYAPWISPFWTNQLVEPTAAWIEQLTEDRSVLVPWITPDDQHASRVVMMFVEGVRFIIDTLPGCNNVLSYAWEFYVLCYANPAIKQHILDVVHYHIGAIAWQRFWPSIQDMDLMLKVVNQFLPSCHTILGNIFVDIPWTAWVTNVTANCDEEIAAKSHVCLLNLYVKLANEPTVRQKSKVTQMLSTAQKFAWHMVDSLAYGQVVDWWVLSCDPRVVAGLGEAYTNPIDTHVMNLLRVVAAFTPDAKLLHPTTLHKRIMYVRMVIKLLLTCASKHRNILTKHKKEVSTVLYSLLSSIETLVVSSVIASQQVSECTLLVKEVIVVINQPEDSEIRSIALKMYSQWLQGRDSTSTVLQSFMRLIGTDVQNMKTVGELFEICLTSYFKHTVTQMTMPDWKTVSKLIAEPDVGRIEDDLLACGQYLTFHALFFKRLSVMRSIQEESGLLDCLIEKLSQLGLKVTEEYESKLPLLWGIALHLIQRQCEYNESHDKAIRNIRIMITHLNVVGDDKGPPWSFLGTFGFRKQSMLSTKCRFLARSMTVFLQAQLPDGGDRQQLRVDGSSPGAITSSERNGAESAIVPCGDVLKGLRDLETLSSSKGYQELKDVIEMAVRNIKDSSKSIKNAKEFLGLLATELYTQQYLLILKLV